MPIFETQKEVALNHTFRLLCSCENCGCKYILPYTNGVSKDDIETLMDLQTTECEECGVELGDTSSLSSDLIKSN